MDVQSVTKQVSNRLGRAKGNLPPFLARPLFIAIFYLYIFTITTSNTTASPTPSLPASAPGFEAADTIAQGGPTADADSAKTSTSPQSNPTSNSITKSQVPKPLIIMTTFFSSSTTTTTTTTPISRIIQLDFLRGLLGSFFVFWILIGTTIAVLVAVGIWAKRFARRGPLSSPRSRLGMCPAGSDGDSTSTGTRTSVGANMDGCRSDWSDGRHRGDDTTVDAGGGGDEIGRKQRSATLWPV